MPWMQIAGSHLNGQVYAPAGARITIGRHEDNVVCIPDSTVSGHHAVLTREADGYRLEDLESTNGTFVNGERVAAAPLGAVAKLQFGVIEVLYIDRAEAPPAEPAPAADRAPPARPKVVVVPVTAPGSTAGRPLRIGSVLEKRRGAVQTVSIGQGGNDSRNARP